MKRPTAVLEGVLAHVNGVLPVLVGDVARPPCYRRRRSNILGAFR